MEPTPKISNFYFKSNFDSLFSLVSCEISCLHFLFNQNNMVSEIKGINGTKRDKRPNWSDLNFCSFFSIELL